MVLMHMKGEPKTMQDDPTYYDVVAEVRGFLGDRIEAAPVGGHRPRAALRRSGDRVRQDARAQPGDPPRHPRVPSPAASRCSSGPSRKRFIGTLTGTEVDDRIEGTAGVVAWCAAEGVDVVRVHDVKEMTRVVRVVDAIARASG